MTLQEYLTNNYSPTATAGYYNMIKRYLLAVGDQALGAGYRDILAYVGLLRTQGLHPKSLRNNLFAIKIYYTYLVETAERNDHPCRYLNLKDQINRQIPVESLYSKQTLEELYTHWQSNSPAYQCRDKIIISLLVYQALKAQEIIKLKLKDIDLTRGTISIESTPKNNGRTLSLKPNQILLFLSYLQERISTDKTGNACFLINKYNHPFSIGAVNRIVNQNRPDTDKLIPLKIRQSVIALLLKENNDIRVVQEFAGHKRTGSTENYKQTGLEELKSAIEKLHPLQ